MVSRGVLASRRLLSHYVPAFLLSFVEACICVPAYTFIRATHFSHFIPLSFRPRRSLVNMIFLNSHLLARARARPFALIYTIIPLISSNLILRSLISRCDAELSHSHSRPYSFLSFSSRSPSPALCLALFLFRFVSI